MARRSHKERDIRQLLRIGNGSIAVTLPIDDVRALDWREGKQVMVRRSNNTLIISAKK
ncbi:MAG: hypothetical protein Q8P93_00580 [bacterium]|nr:hypothetical protein [bacterium]